MGLVPSSSVSATCRVPGWATLPAGAGAPWRCPRAASGSAGTGSGYWPSWAQGGAEHCPWAGETQRAPGDKKLSQVG